MKKNGETSRREFVKSVAGAGVLLGAPTILGATRKGQSKRFKIGLIGCGGRGVGAAVDALEGGEAIGYEVQVVALADYFKERALRAAKRLNVPEERCFGGPNCYKDLVATDAEIVLIAAAPLFRPLQLEAVIQANKHAFIEKPVAVDPPGCRRVMAAAQEAIKRGLVITSGTEMRHEWDFRRTHQALAVEQALGKLMAGRVSFCIASMFATQPIKPQTADDLVRTWQSWRALSGDHLVEQHVHNIDIANWFCLGPPQSAVGFGGRAQRCAGDMYDFFSIDFDYGNDRHIHSMCRQVNQSWNWVGHEFIFERGKTDGKDYQGTPRQSPIPSDLPQGKTSHHQEQIDTFYHVNKGLPHDEATAVAESTAAAVMGRTSAYTGQQVFWNEMMVDPNAKPEIYNLTMKPTAEDFEKGTVEIPPENVVPVPGFKP